MIHPELAKLLDAMDASPMLPGVIATDDRWQAALLDVLSTLSVDQFIGLAERIIERSEQAGPDPTEDRMIAEIAMFGWNTVIQLLRERQRMERGELPDVD